MLQMTVKVRVPKGQAKATEGKLRKVLLNFKRPDSTKFNKEDNEITWIMRGDVRRLKGIQRTVLFFDHIISKTLDNKLMKKYINKNIDKDGRKDLEDMLLNHTSIEITEFKPVKRPS